MNAKELVKLLNDQKIIQKGEWIECIPEDIYEKHLKSCPTLAKNIDRDIHRWYETAITVVAFGDEYIGVRGITKLYSEESSYEDCRVTLGFYEMSEIKVVSYEIKPEVPRD